MWQNHIQNHKKIKKISDNKKNEKVLKEEEDTETDEPINNNENNKENNPVGLNAPTEAYQSVLLDDDTGELTADDLDYSSVGEDLESSEDEQAPLDEDPLAI